MKEVSIERVSLNDETYYKISNVNKIRPFFMSVLSDSNHWMFISSNGGLTAGRKNADHALFPYYTDDKITRSNELTGSKTIFKVSCDGEIKVWEPFSNRNDGVFKITRNLYKNNLSSKIILEEINNDLDLVFRYQWATSNTYGFIRTGNLINNSENKVEVTLIDGIQNILPCGVPSDLQSASSNLVDAYKRTELDLDTKLAMYALSAIIVDKAEPSEALKANVVWSVGLSDPTILLSSLQLNQFRRGGDVKQEEDVKAEKGAYFVSTTLQLEPGTEQQWSIVANVNQSQADVVALIELLKSDKNLQCTADPFKDSRHFANVLFNNMRGGIFDYNYRIERWDFEDYVENANIELAQAQRAFLDSLPARFTYQELREEAVQTGDLDLIRLAIEYLPLRFSRRHGDPSRPWNQFSINTRDEKDGSKVLDYEGNWRDIFQNWEALVHSFPGFIDGMIFRFLNASTFDGYNPYRITKDGFDWEVIDPDDPWSFIGYWGDHQVIYLLKFLEFIENHYPNKLEEYMDRDLFVYANVPYKIKPYEQIVDNPKDTIIFDEETDLDIRKRRSGHGADGALLRNEKGKIHRVGFVEKILAMLLSKLSNYVPEAGIWMNTQRPEWNDANNALVGNGVSMVTLCYLRRFLGFFKGILERTSLERVSISSELMEFYREIRGVLEESAEHLNGSISDRDRKKLMDALGKAASDYRTHIYNSSFWSAKRSISIEGLLQFIHAALSHIDHSIKANERDDHLYHAYNLISIPNGDEVEISHLSKMLEGQVAVLSSGLLSASQSLRVLNAMKNSDLFRPDQYSYLLYPAKKLPGFLERNQVPSDLVEDSVLLKQLLDDENKEIIVRDVRGVYRFNSSFRNAKDLMEALDDLDEKYCNIAKRERKKIAGIFETVFRHREFTGRSGTFYGYEGLGSIYWHMVSKLLLAIQESCLDAIREKAKPGDVGGLLDHYYEISAGIGVHKSPELYGAFPTDPYSHTPMGKGAQQPGMTGQVKEDILCRYGELGVFVKNGELFFEPVLLRKGEFLEENRDFEYVDVTGQPATIEVPKGSLAFTYCQIPVVYTLSEKGLMTLEYNDGKRRSSEQMHLSSRDSTKVFRRTGEIRKIEVHIKSSILK